MAFYILVVDIFTRLTNITVRSFKLILSTIIISTYDQFLSEDHCYNIVNHCLQHYQCSNRVNSIVKEVYNKAIEIYLLACMHALQSNSVHACTMQLCAAHANY